MSLNDWEHFMAKNEHIKIGELLLFTVYMQSTGPCLLVNHVPKIEL